MSNWRIKHCWNFIFDANFALQSHTRNIRFHLGCFWFAAALQLTAWHIPFEVESFTFRLACKNTALSYVFLFVCSQFCLNHRSLFFSGFTIVCANMHQISNWMLTTQYMNASDPLLFVFFSLSIPGWFFVPLSISILETNAIEHICIVHRTSNSIVMIKKVSMPIWDAIYDDIYKRLYAPKTNANPLFVVVLSLENPCLFDYYFSKILKSQTNLFPYDSNCYGDFRVFYSLPSINILRIMRAVFFSAFTRWFVLLIAWDVGILEWALPCKTHKFKRNILKRVCHVWTQRKYFNQMRKFHFMASEYETNFPSRNMRLAGAHIKELFGTHKNR